MTTLTPAFTKTIRYDRSTHDYRAELDGQLIGYYPSYHAAEMALDDAAYDRLIAGDCHAAAELDAPIEAEQLPPLDPTLEGDEEGDTVPPDRERCSCGVPAVYVVYERGTTHRVCDTCYQREFDQNEERATAWFVDSIISAPPLAFTRQSIQIEAGIKRCRICDGAHFSWRCPTVAEVPTPAPYDTDEVITLWATSRALLVAKLAQLTEPQLICQAMAFAAWLNERTQAGMGAESVLHIWKQMISAAQTPGPAAPALRLAA